MAIGFELVTDIQNEEIGNTYIEENIVLELLYPAYSFVHNGRKVHSNNVFLCHVVILI